MKVILEVFSESSTNIETVAKQNALERIVVLLF
jgi:hypothetical protein